LSQEKKVPFQFVGKGCIPVSEGKQGKENPLGGGGRKKGGPTRKKKSRGEVWLVLNHRGAMPKPEGEQGGGASWKVGNTLVRKKKKSALILKLLRERGCQSRVALSEGRTLENPLEPQWRPTRKNGQKPLTFEEKKWKKKRGYVCESQNPSNAERKKKKRVEGKGRKTIRKEKRCDQPTEGEKERTRIESVSCCNYRGKGLEEDQEYLVTVVC